MNVRWPLKRMYFLSTQNECFGLAGSPVVNKLVSYQLDSLFYVAVDVMFSTVTQTSGCKASQHHSLMLHYYFILHFISGQSNDWHLFPYSTSEITELRTLNLSQEPDWSFPLVHRDDLALWLHWCRKLTKANPRAVSGAVSPQLQEEGSSPAELALAGWWKAVLALSQYHVFTITKFSHSLV